MTFVEQNCTIEFEGKRFSNGGSFLVTDSRTNKLVGLLYAFPKTNQVGSWDGNLKIDAHFGNQWQSNMGDIRQVVRFEYEGKKFSGIYYKSGSDIVRVREVEA